MSSTISVREGEKPLLVMDGTNRPTELWMFDPRQLVFFCHDPEARVKIYQRKDKDWLVVSVAPSPEWQSVSDIEMVGLLNGMEQAISRWMKSGGHRAKG